MKHARDDYNRIQDPECKIAEDEPVFLLRAKDATAPATLEFWAGLQRQYNGDLVLAEMAENHAKLMREWQSVNGSKMPDL
jgi:hypothetical protein